MLKSEECDAWTDLRLNRAIKTNRVEMSYVQIKYIQNAHIKFKHIHMSNYSLKPVFSTRYREFILSYREEVSSNWFNIIVLSSL